jgi:hypothetical protein
MATATAAPPVSRLSRPLSTCQRDSEPAGGRIDQDDESARNVPVNRRGAATPSAL